MANTGSSETGRNLLSIGIAHLEDDYKDNSLEHEHIAEIAFRLRRLEEACPDVRTTDLWSRIAKLRVRLKRRKKRKELYCVEQLT